MDIIEWGIGPNGNIPAFILVGLSINADVQEPTAHVIVRVRAAASTVQVRAVPSVVRVE